MGNLLSIKSAINYLNYDCVISSDNEVIENSKILILPGVGSFYEAMTYIKSKKIDQSIKVALSKDSKILGICLGMQLLGLSSDEDEFTTGLSLIKLKFEKFNTSEVNNAKIPHIGFNSVTFNQKDKLFKGIKQNSYFYFVHSYRTLSNDNEYPFLCSHFKYGKKFISSFSKNNIFGTQFHPEKSQTNGLLLIKNFINSIENS